MYIPSPGYRTIHPLVLDALDDEFTLSATKSVGAHGTITIQCDHFCLGVLGDWGGDRAPPPSHLAYPIYHSSFPHLPFIEGS